MRCPKCGYTSFDHLESCKKCHKSFGPLAEEVNGTTYEAVAPLFLKITKNLEERQDEPPVQQLHFDEIEIEEEPSSIVRQGIDTEFILEEQPLPSFQEEAIALSENSEELVVDLDEIQEVAPRHEFTLDLDNNSEADDAEAQLPPIDFGDLDISDLAPPGRETELNNEEIERLVQHEPSLATASPSASPLGQTPQPAQTIGLEDLNFNGLDLESPARIVSGSAAGKRYLPSVKTGTALDKFDIDLGDLFGSEKKEKND
jgi:hypothetical protein